MQVRPRSFETPLRWRDDRLANEIEGMRANPAYDSFSHGIVPAATWLLRGAA